MTKRTTKGVDAPTLFKDDKTIDGTVIIEERKPAAKQQVAAPSAKTQAVAVRKTDEPQNMLAVIARAAADKRVDVDKMRELLAMQQAIEAREAEREFNVALMAAQSELPKIVKDASVKETSGSTKYRFATLEKVATEVDHVARKHGFSQSFGTADSPLSGHYRIICDLSHSGGHTRRYLCDLQLDAAGAKGTANKTPVQGVGSTMSYGRRYLKVMMFDLIIVGEDRDGNRRKEQDGPSSITMEQAQEIRALADKVGCPLDRIVAHLNLPNMRRGFPEIEEVTELPPQRFEQAMAALRSYSPHDKPKGDGAQAEAR